MREYQGISRRSVFALAAAAVSLVVVALAALGSRAIRVPDDQVTHRDEVLVRFVVGAIAVSVVALVVLGVAIIAARRDERVAHALDASGPWRTRRFIGRAAPWVLAAMALGAVLGAATAPLHPRDETPAGRPPSGPQPSDPRTDAGGGQVDGRLGVYEGAIVRDQLGRTHVSIDRDGDGQLDLTLVPCPRGGAATNNVPARDRDGFTLVPIDNDCDGTIDGYVRLRSLEPVDPGDAPLDDLRSGANATRPTTPPAPSTSSTDRLTGGSSLPRVLLFIGLAIAALALAVAGARLVRRTPVTEPDDVDEVPAPLTMAAPLEVLHRATDPRAGIIEAYGQLLAVLAAAGLARHPHEGPEEYLRRCAASLRVRHEPMATLTELFAVARFSSHALSDAHLERAIGALVAVDGDLAGARAQMPVGVS